MVDIYQDASSTLRSVFPNSRLDSLAGVDRRMESQLSGPPDPDAVTTASSIGHNPLNDDDWWANAIEVDTFDSPLAFDASENGLWNGHFVPPPPRPPFLDESVAADGLTTCDLCTWAWQRNAYSLDGSIETTGELGWAFTLIIVSIISALIGAIVMVIVLRCRRIKSANANGGRPQPWWCRNNRNGGQNRSPISIKHSADSIRRPTSNSGVWTWLGGSRRSSAGPDQIGPPSTSPAENHYTHMDDAYSPVGVSEALYAELDRESVRSANPSYQNTAYSQCGEKYNYQGHEQDIPMVVSSAPSSAYYSDLSVTAMPGGASGSNQGAYEIVGLNVMSQPLPNWDHHGGGGGGGGAAGAAAAILGAGGGGNGITAGEAAAMTQRRGPRLAAINETSTSTVPSDYV
ncbi:uncharacterized protein LOC108045996 [Drosophila rhopaloa]|uniref:Uncharacterized protein n=2 Tax=Drosophila rhopaloa TaxID=1041015 RepID=A0ABM5J4K9_DRORH|nr:uncharacterized protein LOC108045996 [Drosophila rhopaloa]XP_044313761.1 uncharacterized protein LOC108045996 [Drosophila rhopaloa]